MIKIFQIFLLSLFFFVNAYANKSNSLKIGGIYLKANLLEFLPIELIEVATRKGVYPDDFIYLNFSPKDELKKYLSLNLDNQEQHFDQIEFFLKNVNGEFEVHGMSGFVACANEIIKCSQLKNKFEKIFDNNFTRTDKITYNFPNNEQYGENSKDYMIYYKKSLTEDSLFKIGLMDFNNSQKYRDNFYISIFTTEFDNWLINVTENRK